MNWGLIGASTIASQFMIDAIRAIDGNEVVAVFSSSDQRGEIYAEQHSIAKHTASLNDLLADLQIDAVYISTTNEKHKEQALAAIAAGKHVVCEKPLAMNVADAIEMVAAAANAGVTFATNHHLRNAGSHLKIKELIPSGAIGAVQSIRIFHAVHLPKNLQGWRIDNAAAGGGVIPDIVVHDADTVRFYLEEDPASVVAIERAESMGQGVEDSVMSIWSMPSDVMVQTHESFTHRFARTGVEVNGTEGSIVAQSVNTQNPTGEMTLTNANGSRQIEFSNHNLYARSMQKFVDAVNGNGSPSATGLDGIKSLAVAMAVKEAATSGASVDIDYGGL